MKAILESVWTWTVAQDWTGLLAGFAVKSFIVLLAAWLLLRVWRKASAAVRHWVWLLALVSVFLAPWQPAQFSRWSVPLWSPPADRASNNELGSITGELNNRAGTGHPLAEDQSSSSSLAGKAVTREAERSLEGTLHLPLALLLAWALGFFVLTGRIVFAHWKLRGMEKSAKPVLDSEPLACLDKVRAALGLRRRVRLLESPDSLLPMTWGTWRPVVLLPPEAKDWTPERVQIVLRHELAHVKRRDCLAQVVGQLACAFCWFNPLAWLAARQMRIERERACDDLVLASGAAPSSYAEHLLEIARRFSIDSLASSAAIAIARPPQIAERIVAIVDAHRNRRHVTLLVSILTLGAAGLLVGSLSLCRLQARPAENANAADAAAKFARLKPYFATKEKQARALVQQETNAVSPDIWKYFEAAAKGDWNAATNIYWQMRLRCYQFEKHNAVPTEVDPQLSTMAWQPVNETYGLFEHFAFGEEKHVVAYGQDIIDSIPAGSIYFGGTDPGRWIVTGMSKSHEKADPFFTLTQNALADGLYLNYIRTMYGGKIYTPTDGDSKAMFEEYTTDAQARMSKGQLRPGEDVRIVDGKAKTSGQVAVMAINALIAKKIFDQNPDREFYIEESFPLEWMYPHLTPNGLIMKINRERLTEITEDMVRKDRDYWSRYTARLIGGWLKDDTSVAELCRRAEKIHAEKDSGADGGDPKFAANEYSCKMFSKLRASLGGVYAWRANSALRDAREHARMTREADYAFRQAYALCPYSPEALYRYVQLLASARRFDDALLLARTSSRLDPSNQGLERLSQELERMRASIPPGAADSELQKLESDYRAEPFNVSIATRLAQKYGSLGRTEEPMRMADAFLAYANAGADGISFAAQAYQQAGNYPKLERALARWVQLKPTPEAWLDYAAAQVMQKKSSEAMASLRKALELNWVRLQNDPQASDVAKGLKNDARFVSLRDNPEFQKLFAVRP
jgi:beta-lactamase regulating signal transducer with metallopeptidase domain